jgi:hypothetical protein
MSKRNSILWHFYFSLNVGKRFIEIKGIVTIINVHSRVFMCEPAPQTSF